MNPKYIDMVSKYINTTNGSVEGTFSNKITGNLSEAKKFLFICNPVASSNGYTFALIINGSIIYTSPTITDTSAKIYINNYSFSSKDIISYKITYKSSGSTNGTGNMSIICF